VKTLDDEPSDQLATADDQPAFFKARPPEQGKQ
jgi:hypothetical protein